jgi:hypothetical protein
MAHDSTQAARRGGPRPISQIIREYVAGVEGRRPHASSPPPEPDPGRPLGGLAVRPPSTAAWPNCRPGESAFQSNGVGWRTDAENGCPLDSLAVRPPSTAAWPNCRPGESAFQSNGVERKTAAGATTGEFERGGQATGSPVGTTDFVPCEHRLERSAAGGATPAGFAPVAARSTGRSFGTEAGKTEAHTGSCRPVPQEPETGRNCQPARSAGIHLELPYELASSHWAAERLPANTRGTDFMTLCYLLLHARALSGQDLNILSSFGLAEPEDEGRLYVRVTDLGLSIETGLRRQTVAQSIQRLAKRGLLDVRPLPPGFGGYHGLPFSDSHGSTMGTKVYLLSREVGAVFDLSREVVQSRP